MFDQGSPDLDCMLLPKEKRIKNIHLRARKYASNLICNLIHEVHRYRHVCLCLFVSLGQFPQNEQGNPRYCVLMKLI